MSSFSETLRRIRFEHHMTQEEFAELLGTTKQNISRYESGAVSPKISTAAIIADKLGLSLSELSGEDNPIQEKPSIPIRKSKEWRVLSEGFERMEKQEYDSFMAYFKMLTTTRPDLFNERNDDDDPES